MMQDTTFQGSAVPVDKRANELVKVWTKDA